MQNNVKFVDVHLPYNKLSLWLLAKDSITRTKKRLVVENKNKANKFPKVRATREMRILVKQVDKKSFQASVPISGLAGKPFPDI